MSKLYSDTISTITSYGTIFAAKWSNNGRFDSGFEASCPRSNETWRGSIKLSANIKYPKILNERINPEWTRIFPDPSKNLVFKPQYLLNYSSPTNDSLRFRKRQSGLSI